MSLPTIARFSDAASFRAVAEPWLLQREAEHSIPLGILPALASGSYPYELPLYLSTVNGTDGIRGCAFRTPPFHLGVTTMPATAIEPLLDDVAEVYPTLSGVIGPPDHAGPVAQIWADRHGLAARVAMRQGIYELRDLVRPATRPVGVSRLADAADAPLLHQWAHAVVEETGIPAHDVDGLADRLVAARGMMLWEVAGNPTCMAAVTGDTPNGIRVSYVYTPPESRGAGYASALVAELSATQFRNGKRLCFLYTDLTNPTSNTIYKKLGYQHVAESVEVVIEP